MFYQVIFWDNFLRNKCTINYLSNRIGTQNNTKRHIIDIALTFLLNDKVGSDQSLHVDEVEPAECLGHTGDDGPVALSIVVQLEQRRRHQLVVPGHGEVGLLWELDQEQLPVLLGLGDVRRDVGVLGWLEVWSPPVPDGVLDHPLGGRAVRPAQGAGHQPLESLHLVLARLQLPAGQLEERRPQLEQQDVRQAMLVDQQQPKW